MATPEQRHKTVEAVRGKLKYLADIDPQSLARTDDLSRDINFEEAVPNFEEMLDICKQLNDRNISQLSSSKLKTILNVCTKLSDHIDKVQNFSLNQNTPGDIAKGIIDEINHLYDEIIEPLLLPLAFTATQATDYGKTEREAKDCLATIKAESEKLSSFMTTVQSEAEKSLAAVKEQAAEAGVSSNSQFFLKDAEKHSLNAGKWKLATIIMIVITLGAGIGVIAFDLNYQPANTGAAIQYVFAKLIVLSTLSFVIFWCARNYKAQMHNETLNKHRANALMTFRAFVEGTSDERVKDALLLQAAQAAFSGRHTGYDGHEKDTQTISPVVEILGKVPQALNSGS